MTHNNISRKEDKKGEEARNKVDEKTRDFYSEQYSIDIYNPDAPRKFKGLSCRVCNRWIEYGHAPDCPVGKL